MSTKIGSNSPAQYFASNFSSTKLLTTSSTAWSKVAVVVDSSLLVDAWVKQYKNRFSTANHTIETINQNLLNFNPLKPLS
jgi:hypothetical protein